MTRLDEKSVSYFFTLFLYDIINSNKKPIGKGSLQNWGWGNRCSSPRRLIQNAHSKSQNWNKYVVTQHTMCVIRFHTCRSVQLIMLLLCRQNCHHRDDALDTCTLYTFGLRYTLLKLTEFSMHSPRPYDPEFIPIKWNALTKFAETIARNW